MRRRGFTIIELAIVISISAILVPAVYLFARTLEDQQAIGLRHLEVADQTRTLAEALGADRRGLHFSGPTSLKLEGPSPCAPVEYSLTPARTVERRDCSGTTTLATQVQSLGHVAGGVAIAFGFEKRPGLVLRTELFIPVED